MSKELSEKARNAILAMQKNEITEYYIYSDMASKIKDEANRKVVENIAAEELAHYEIWKGYTDTEVAPKKFKIFIYKVITSLMGFTFAAKRMEGGEEGAQVIYGNLAEEVPEAAKIQSEESAHEASLLEMLDEERLRYVGSMVLGLNDALVELTGTLAGLSFALRNTRLIALSGLITGISATLSMASSEYLSAKSEGRDDALKSCVYTGIAYLVTVALLVLPYLVMSSYIAALITMILTVIVIIAFFNYYISVAKGYNFRRRFTEMLGISLSVAVISFVIGLLVSAWLGV